MLINLLWGVSRCASATPAPCDAQRIVHLVYGLWDDGPLPFRFWARVGSWLRHHPSPHWQVVLWTRPQAEALIDAHFPELAPTYRAYQRPVQRADLLRYLLLYHYGGFYADLDIVCRQSLSSLLQDQPSMVVQVETTLTPERCREIGQGQPIRQGRAELELRIANYFLGCRAGDPIMGEVIQLVQERSHLPIRCDYDVLYTTGPDVVSEVIHRRREQPGLKILSLAQAESFVRHDCCGSWREN